VKSETSFSVIALFALTLPNQVAAQHTHYTVTFLGSGLFASVSVFALLFSIL